MSGPDVVAQGPEPGPSDEGPSWWRRAVLAAAGLVAVVVVAQSGVLSAGEPDRPEPSPTAGAVEAPVGPLPVVRVGDQLHTVTRTRLLRGPRLPGSFSPEGPLVPVLRADGTGFLVGVQGNTLFRADPDRERTRPLGDASSVVAVAAGTSRALVDRGGDVVVVEVATGSTVNEQPFPGYDPDQGWRPRGVVQAVGRTPLVLSRGTGEGEQLALAWPSGGVGTNALPALEVLGAYGPLLGISEDWLLTLGACPGPSCEIRVLSITRDQVSARAVHPPRGWSFTAGPIAGRSTEALVPVARDGTRALARLVPGGDNALLIQSTDRVHLEAGLATAADGSVYLLQRTPDGDDELQLRVWDPRDPARARLVRSPRLPSSTRLVCACG